jgi:hypothetical protein
MTSIFLSYARDDDEAFARRLYEDLLARDFEVWFDRESMPSRQLTFLKEIADAIAAHDRFLLVIGPNAVTSDYVIQEWRKALELDKCINPIIRLDKQWEDGRTTCGYDLLPVEIRTVHAEDFRDDTHYVEHLNNLVRQLSEPLPSLGKLFDVPTLPKHYIAQRERLCQLKETLLIDLQSPVIINGLAARLGVKGMAGIGKSILASALVREPGNTVTASSLQWTLDGASFGSGETFSATVPVPATGEFTEQFTYKVRLIRRWSIDLLRRL